MRLLSTELFRCSLIRGAALVSDAGRSVLAPSPSDLLLFTFGAPPAPLTGEPFHGELALQLAAPLEGALPGLLQWRAARLAIGHPVPAFVAERARGELKLVGLHRHAHLQLDLELSAPEVDTEAWGSAQVVGLATARNVRWAPRLDADRGPAAVAAILKELVAELRPHVYVDAGTRLDALALSSLELHRLTFEAEDVFGVELDALDPTRVTTLAELADHLAAAGRA